MCNWNDVHFGEGKRWMNILDEKSRIRYLIRCSSLWIAESVWRNDWVSDIQLKWPFSFLGGREEGQCVSKDK